VARPAAATAEVGIIGAGIHGASAAFHLASRGVRVAVIERGAPASGPTGRSSAICRAYYTSPYLARVAKASLDMFRSFGELTGGRECGFHATGALYLHPGSDAEGVGEAAAYMNEIGWMASASPHGNPAQVMPTLSPPPPAFSRGRASSERSCTFTNRWWR
jgi:glycine/D-amino acid oxidase-like deaminating enzyme